jgi:hypothetical protein
MKIQGIVWKTNGNEDSSVVGYELENQGIVVQFQGNARVLIFPNIQAASGGHPVLFPRYRTAAA